MSLLEDFINEVRSKIVAEELFKDIKAEKRILPLSELLKEKGGFVKSSAGPLELDVFLVHTDYDNTVTQVVKSLKEEIDRVTGSLFTRKNPTVTELCISVPGVEVSNVPMRFGSIAIKAGFLMKISADIRFSDKFYYGVVQRYGEFKPLTGEPIRIVHEQEAQDFYVSANPQQSW